MGGFLGKSHPQGGDLLHYFAFYTLHFALAPTVTKCTSVVEYIEFCGRAHLFMEGGVIAIIPFRFTLISGSLTTPKPSSTAAPHRR